MTRLVLLGPIDIMQSVSHQPDSIYSSSLCARVLNQENVTEGRTICIELTLVHEEENIEMIYWALK